MSQISPPMRIVLAVAVVFLAAYMLVLKPKDEEPAPAATPAVPAAEAGGPEANTSLGQAVEGAREAAGAAESAAAARAGETATGTAPSTTQSTPSDSPESTPAQPAGASSDPALAKLPKWLQKSMDEKVVAILFTNNKSADDERTHEALRHAYSGDGDVVRRAVPVSEISKYQAVAEGVDVSQSPTLLVIARDRSAEIIGGYASVDTINQAIVDALLATDNPRESVEWLQLAQKECKQISNRSMIGVTPGETPAGVRKNVAATMAVMGSSLGTLRNAPIPARYKPVKDMLTRYIASEMAVGRQVQATLGGKEVDAIKVTRVLAGNDKLQSRTVLEMNAHGVSSCN
jgi:hypothetical protein